MGVTGGIGSGKSSAVRLLAGLGATVIDADRVGHEVYAPGTPGFDQVVAAFGKDIVGADGAIDRKRLGAIVFGDAAALARLNGIVHPLIRDAVAQRVAAARASGAAPVVVEAALLIEARWDTLVDEVWLVVARREVIVERLADQRGMDPAAVAARMRAQLSDEERRAHAVVVIDNSGSREQLREQIERLWRARLKA
ncbi:dephospho-CoA kinase [bacterium]|nr:dephospho-CoA kinase [bacterium]